MANISEFYGTLMVPEQAFKLESFAKVWRRLVGMQILPSAIDSYLNIEKDYVNLQNNRIYNFSGGAAWTFDDSVNFLFAQFSVEYEKNVLYQKMLEELSENKLTLQYQITEYEPGYDILDEECGRLQVVNSKLTADIFELFQYDCVPEEIMKLGFEV